MFSGMNKAAANEAAVPIRARCNCFRVWAIRSFRSVSAAVRVYTSGASARGISHMASNP